MPLEPLDIASPLVIREMTGDKRTIQLSGRALPYRPFDLEGSMETNLSWQPGSPLATSQVLGPREAPTTFRGAWKDRFVGNQGDGSGQVLVDGTPLASARDIVDELDDVRRKGQQVEVTLLSRRRTGTLKRLRQSWDNAHDVMWEMEFEWISQAEDEPENLTRAPDLVTIVEDAGANLSELDDATPPAVGAAIAPSVATELAAFVSNMQRSIADASEAVFNAVDGALSPVDSASRMLGMLQFISSEAQDLIDALNSRVDRTIAAAGDATTVADIPITVSLRATIANRKLVSRARRNRHHAVRNSVTLADTVEPDLLGVAYASEGDNLRDISTAWYGTPDEYRALRRFNRLTSSRLSAGQIVLIPRQGRGL